MSRGRDFVVPNSANFTGWFGIFLPAKSQFPPAIAGSRRLYPALGKTDNDNHNLVNSIVEIVEIDNCADDNDQVIAQSKHKEQERQKLLDPCNCKGNQCLNTFSRRD